MDETDLDGLGRLEARALEQDLHQRVGDAEHADGARDATATGEQAEARLRQTDVVATLGRDAVVRREGDLEATTEGGAVDRRGDGLARGLETAERGLDALDLVEELGGVLLGGLQHQLQVTAGEEGLLRRGDDGTLDGAGLDVGDVGVDRGGHAVAVGLVHRVGALVRVVEDDVTDLVLDLVAHGCSHEMCLSSLRSRAGQRASMTVAMPMPPPTQSVARP